MSERVSGQFRERASAEDRLNTQDQTNEPKKCACPYCPGHREGYATLELRLSPYEFDETVPSRQLILDFRPTTETE